MQRLRGNKINMKMDSSDMNEQHFTAVLQVAGCWLHRKSCTCIGHSQQLIAASHGGYKHAKAKTKAKAKKKLNRYKRQMCRESVNRYAHLTHTYALVATKSHH